MAASSIEKNWKSISAMFFFLYYSYKSASGQYMSLASTQHAFTQSIKCVIISYCLNHENKSLVNNQDIAQQSVQHAFTDLENSK